MKRQAVDSRRAEVRFVYTLHVTLGDEARQRQLESQASARRLYTEEPDIDIWQLEDAGTPVVVSGAARADCLQR